MMRALKYVLLAVAVGLALSGLRHSHSHADTSSHTDRDSRAHSNAFRGTHSYAHAYCGAHSYSYAYTYACCGAYFYSRSDAATASSTGRFEVSVSEAALQLPDSISFHLEGRGERPIETVDVEFGADNAFSCASTSYWSARTDIEAGQDVAVTWDWDMRRSGSLPPGATVWWRWRVVDDLGQEFRTPRQETVFADDRFDWQAHTAGNVTYNWYAGGPDFGSRIADGVRGGLDNLELGKELE